MGIHTPINSDLSPLYLDEIWRCDAEPEAKAYGEVTLGDTLSRMSESMSALRAIRKIDPDAYHYFANIGAPISGEQALYSVSKVSPEFLRAKPSYQGVFLGIADSGKGEMVNCKFVYLQKVTRPVNVQPTNQHCYRVVVAWRHKGQLLPASFHVGISDDGDVTPLKELRVEHLRHQGRYIRSAARWGYWDLVDIAADRDGETVEDVASSFVCLCSSAMPDPNSMVVIARKGRGRVSFRVHRRATAKFFRDRDLKDRGGSRIFHYRRAHYRRSGGEWKLVSSAYPGLRKFHWKGYSVLVAMPKVNASEADSFDASAFDARDAAVSGSKLVSMQDAAPKIRNAIYGVGA